MSPTAAKKSSASSRKSATKSPLFEVRRSKIQGRGVFATAPIRKGKRITEYLGEPITHEEADRRYDDKNGRHHTFLFILDDDTVLDARYRGSDAKYINHSCDPNCESVIDGQHIWINAIKSIQPGTELVYDYQFEWQDEYEPEDVRYYACRCGTDKCRGTIIKVPVYLRSTVKRWLAGDDVKKPRKPAKKSKEAAKKRARKAPTKRSTAAAKKRSSAATKKRGSATKKRAK
ncbi:MAG: SET domain-containing protein-lysine N-methyltransferase [Gemmatimonas sp.]